MLDLLKGLLSVSANANVAGAGFQTSLFIEDCVCDICHAAFASVGGAHALILKDMSADSKRCLGNHRCCIPSPCITVVTVPKVMCYVSFSHCQKMTGSTYLDNGTDTHARVHTHKHCWTVTQAWGQREPGELVVVVMGLDHCSRTMLSLHSQGNPREFLAQVYA